MIPLILTIALMCGTLVLTRLLEDADRRPVLIALAMILVSTAGATRYDTTDPRTAQLATSGPVSMSLSRGFTALTDLDGDGFSRDDCSIWDPDIHPNAIEVLGNGVDENCSGADEQWQDPVPVPSIVPQKQRNVFLVSIDTLRFDAVGKKVNGESLTPRLDAFAQKSLVFSRAYAPSTYTNESMPSIMSSEYPQRWHAAQTYFGQEDTIAQMLAKNGYQTLAVIAFPWLHDGAILGFEKVDNEFGLVQQFGAERGRDVVARMFDELERRDERPLLAWIHLFEPHAPNPGKLFPGFSNDAVGRYDQDVKAADIAFGEFIDGLAARGLLDDSLIFVFADHGEALGEHNMSTHLWAAWNSVTHVPLIVRIPGVAGRNIAVPVSTIDILPTVARVLGLPVVGPRDGPSLPMENTESERAVFTFADSQSGEPLTRALVQGDKKLIWDVSSESWLLFDVVKDPRELRPIDDPALLNAMKRRLLTWLALTRNDRLLKRKADLWETRELFYPLEYKGDVGLMLELTPR
ncbi:MAG: sulfatase [bacterium]